MKVLKSPSLQLAPLLIVHTGYTACRTANPPNQIRTFALHNTAGNKKNKTKKKKQAKCNTTDLLRGRHCPSAADGVGGTAKAGNFETAAY